MDPQTTGLWIWARSHPRNDNLTVLLMDTEGLDSPHIPQWYNWVQDNMNKLLTIVLQYNNLDRAIFLKNRLFQHWRCSSQRYLSTKAKGALMRLPQIVSE